MKLTRDQLEYSISQYLDGNLDELAQATLEETLATDANARHVFAEYQALQGAMKSALPLPDVDWDQFASRVSSETAKLDAPVKHYRINVGAWSKVAALAAMVTIIVGVIVKVRPGGSMTEVGTGSVAVNPTPIDVQISAPPALAAAPVSDIQIGQPSGVALADYHATDAIVTTSSSIWIASGDAPAQDTEQPLY